MAIAMFKAEYILSCIPESIKSVEDERLRYHEKEIAKIAIKPRSTFFGRPYLFTREEAEAEYDNPYGLISERKMNDWQFTLKRERICTIKKMCEKILAAENSSDGLIALEIEEMAILQLPAINENVISG